MDNFDDDARRRYMEADHKSDKEILDNERNIILDDNALEPIEDRRTFMKWLLDSLNHGYCDE